MNVITNVNVATCPVLQKGLPMAAAVLFSSDVFEGTEEERLFGHSLAWAVTQTHPHHSLNTFSLCNSEATGPVYVSSLWNKRTANITPPRCEEPFQWKTRSYKQHPNLTFRCEGSQDVTPWNTFCIRSVKRTCTPTRTQRIRSLDSLLWFAVSSESGFNS